MKLHIDIESRSLIDLTRVGVYVYADHPSTEVMMACYAFDDGPVLPPWFPSRSPIPDLLLFALFEFNGGAFRYFRPAPMPDIGFQHCSNVPTSTIDKDPALVASMARALARSVVAMAAAPPEELSKLHFKLFPASRPTTLSDADVLKLDGLRLAARKQFMRLQQRVFDRTEKLGDIADARVAAMRDLLFQGGELAQSLPVDRYFDKRFVEAMNQIDIPATISRAKAFRA